MVYAIYDRERDVWLHSFNYSIPCNNEYYIGFSINFQLIQFSIINVRAIKEDHRFYKQILIYRVIWLLSHKIHHEHSEIINCV